MIENEGQQGSEPHSTLFPVKQSSFINHLSSISKVLNGFQIIGNIKLANFYKKVVNFLKPIEFFTRPWFSEFQNIY